MALTFKLVPAAWQIRLLTRCWLDVCLCLRVREWQNIVRLRMTKTAIWSHLLVTSVHTSFEIYKIETHHERNSWLNNNILDEGCPYWLPCKGEYIFGGPCLSHNCVMHSIHSIMVCLFCSIQSRWVYSLTVLCLTTERNLFVWLHGFYCRVEIALRAVKCWIVWWYANTSWLAIVQRCSHVQTHPTSRMCTSLLWFLPLDTRRLQQRHWKLYSISVWQLAINPTPCMMFS